MKKLAIFCLLFVIFALFIMSSAFAVSNPCLHYQDTEDLNGDGIPDGDGIFEITCTWFCWKQVYETLGIALPSEIGNYHAKSWANVLAGLYQIGDTPKVNSIAVWTNTYYGHVAFVTSVDGENFLVNEGGRTDLDHTASQGTAYGAFKRNSSHVKFVYLEKDNTPPSYSDFHVGEFRTEGFTVMAKVTDSAGISSVRYAIWTEKNGQDDIKWYDGYCTDENDYYWARVNYSGHKNEKGKYIVHMYAYDNSGNVVNPGITYNFDDPGCSVSDYHVGELREEGFTVMAKVTSSIGVKSVRYAIWTMNNEQDDIQWYNGNCTDGNDYFWARVRFSDHKNEKGYYKIHIYTIDNANVEESLELIYYFEENGPEISNVIISDISTQGYSVTCNVNSSVGISRVQFPTWTLANGQDDIASDWGRNTQVSGTIDGNKVSFRVNTADHNNEFGAYVTHIYAYDLIGNYSSASIPEVYIDEHTLVAHRALNATCTIAGHEAFWECSICGRLFADMLATEEITEPRVFAAIGHDWGQPVYSWNADYTEATAYRLCNNDSEHKEEETVVVTSISQPPSNDASGYIVYSAVFENSAFESQEKRIEIPALKELSVLSLPEQLKVLEAEAFSGVSAQAIIIPEGCTTIGPKVFANCPNLIYICVPASVNIVDEHAFDECSPALIHYE